MSKVLQKMYGAYEGPVGMEKMNQENKAGSWIPPASGPSGLNSLTFDKLDHSQVWGNLS